MAILIDGYNLMYAIGWVSQSEATGDWRRCRGNLLSFLATRLDPNELASTTIVFDAQNAPPGLPRELDYQGMRVLFAANHPEADDLIEELIIGNHVPKQLTVVSSDHRIQRAARRRRAHPVDCEPWYAQFEQKPNRKPRASQLPPKPDLEESAEEIQEWLAAFGDAADTVAEFKTPPVDTGPPVDDLAENEEAVDADFENPFSTDYLRRISDEFADE